MRFGFLKWFGVVALAVAAHGAVAQDDDVTRYPADGIAILDCAPAVPAPQDTCVVRIPPGYGLADLESDPLGAVTGEFRLAKPGRVNFPSDLELSATLLLVDLSPGLDEKRRASFESEKELMRGLIDRLPSTEPVAIYGFNEGLRRITDFTTNRATLLSSIEALDLSGSNTRISTFVGDGVTILAEREDLLLRNLILVSDGQEEGNRDLTDVVANAVENGVVISAIGALWQPFGVPENAVRMDYLRALTEGTSGTTVEAQLDRPEAAGNAVGTFASNYSAALSASGLIVPVGTPQPSLITMTLDEPVLGAAGETRENEITATFRPFAEPVVVPVKPEPEPATLFGFDPMVVYIAAGLLAALVLLILLLALRRKDDEDDVAIIEIPEEPAAPEPAPSPKPAKKPASAYLVFADGKRRAGISGEKVSVGRSAANDVVIEAESISRLHAQIYRNRNGGYSVADMDSLNGTYINDAQIKGTEQVRLGDTITFGKVITKLVSA